MADAYHKSCSGCHRSLPRTAFYSSPGGDGLRARCKECVRESNTASNKRSVHPRLRCDVCGNRKTPSAAVCRQCATDDPIARFWGYVLKTDGCWFWKGYTIWNGYGRLVVAYKNILAHRYSWQLANGPIPDGLDVLHECDNRPCVNPDHLFLGTNADNVRDCVQKGRTAKGEKAGRAKLSSAQVQEIRNIYNSGETTTRALAARFGVGHGNVWSIVSRKTWRHVP